MHKKALALTLACLLAAPAAFALQTASTPAPAQTTDNAPASTTPAAPAKPKKTKEEKAAHKAKKAQKAAKKNGTSATDDTPAPAATTPK